MPGFMGVAADTEMNKIHSVLSRICQPYIISDYSHIAYSF